MSPSEWLAFAGMSFVLAVAPGPDNLFVLTQSAVLGARAGLYVVLGLCGGLLLQTIAAALGLAIVIQEFPAVFWAIKIAGALYLCYLAYMAWTHAEDVPGEGGALDLTVGGRLRGGVFEMRGDVSSQFFSGILFALPLVGGELRATTPLASRAYIDMTIAAMREFGVSVEERDGVFRAAYVKIRILPIFFSLL